MEEQNEFSKIKSKANQLKNDGKIALQNALRQVPNELKSQFN